MSDDELVEVAAARALAGVPCAVAGFTNASTAHVVDFDSDGEVERAWSVPVDEPDGSSPIDRPPDLNPGANE